MRGNVIRVGGGVCESSSAYKTFYWGGMKNNKQHFSNIIPSRRMHLVLMGGGEKESRVINLHVQLPSRLTIIHLTGRSSLIYQIWIFHGLWRGGASFYWQTREIGWWLVCHWPTAVRAKESLWVTMTFRTHKWEMHYTKDFQSSDFVIFHFFTAGLRVLQTLPWQRGIRSRYQGI